MYYDIAYYTVVWFNYTDLVYNMQLYVYCDNILLAEFYTDKWLL